jgi:hypothetical protein
VSYKCLKRKCSEKGEVSKQFRISHKHEFRDFTDSLVVSGQRTLGGKGVTVD